MFENGFGIWCVLARPYPTTLFAWRLSILLLPSLTIPDVGFSSPAMMLSSVDFPELFGPIRPRTAESGRSNETPFKACTPPKFFEMLFAWRMGMPIPALALGVHSIVLAVRRSRLAGREP